MVALVPKTSRVRRLDKLQAELNLVLVRCATFRGLLHIQAATIQALNLTFVTHFIPDLWVPQSTTTAIAGDAMTIHINGFNWLIGLKRYGDGH